MTDFDYFARNIGVVIIAITMFLGVLVSAVYLVELFT
jgi:hypothetical protein